MQVTEILNDLIETGNEGKTFINPNESLKEFTNSFNAFSYKFNPSEVFVDFVDYVLLVMKWWEQDRDFSYFENKYTDLFPNFKVMIEQMGS